MNGQNLKIAFITVRCLLVIGCCLTYFLELPKWNLFFSCGTAFIYCTLLASNFMLIKLLTGLYGRFVSKEIDPAFFGYQMSISLAELAIGISCIYEPKLWVIHLPFY